MPALPWPDWSPVPDDWNREFFFYHGDYEFDSVAGRTLFRIDGTTREDHKILLELYGHHPHCYFKVRDACDLARARDLVGYWESRARNTAYAYFGAQSRRVHDQISDVGRWVLEVTDPIREDMIEDRPWERVGVRFRVEFAHPALVKMFREYVLYCRGREADPRVPSWCSDESRLRAFADMLIYEANVDYVERVSVDRGFPPSVWYRIRGWDRCRRATSRPVDYDETGKRYDMVIRACVDRIEPTGDATPHDTRVLAYDIEAENQDGDHMPRAADDAVLDIVLYAYRDGQRDRAESFAFELGSCDSVVDKIFRYRDDRELLQQFRRFVILSRCDAIVAHNGNGFDLPYLIARAKAVGLKDWDLLGPPKRRARITTSVNKGFKKHNAYVPGLLVLDTMRIEQETLGARSLGLADCAIRYLDDKVKMDVHPDEITRLQETHGGRSKKHKYCARDAELVMDIEQAQRGIEGTFKMSRRSVCAQIVLNRSQGSKGEGMIARAAMAKDPPQIMLVLSFMERFMRGRPHARVRGSYAGSKEYEGALNLKPFPLYVAPCAGPRQKVVFTLDFKSMYPSIMRCRNLSADTEVLPDTIEAMGWREGEHYWSSPDYEEDERGEMRVVAVPDNPKFVTPRVRRGIIPAIQDGLATDRGDVKREMARAAAELAELEGEIARKVDAAEALRELERAADAAESDAEDAAAKIAAIEAEIAGADADRRADLRRKKAQLSLEERMIKLLMNSIYGLMARLKAGDASGMIHSIRYVSMAVASTITREGRGLIMLTRDAVHRSFPGSRVVGGDTDSVFVLVEVRDYAEAWVLGKSMEEALNRLYEDPVSIGLENMAVSFEQYRKKNYKKLVFAPRPGGGGWSDEPELIVKGESWVKRNFPRNLKRACGRIADVLITEDVRPDRYERALDEIRAQALRIARREVPVGDLVESSKLSRDLKDYDDPGRMKGPAMLARKYEADLATAKRKRDSEPRARGRKRRAVDVYRPEAGTIASFVIVPPGAGSKKITDRSVPALEAIREGARYDREYYLEQLYKTVSSSFGQALATLSGRDAEIDAAVRDRRLAFEESLERVRRRSGERLSGGDAKLLALAADPVEVEARIAEKERDTRKQLYLRLTKEVAGTPREPEERDARAGVLAFARRSARCRRCGTSACACDHRAEREEKRRRIEAAQERKREAWAKCAECVGGQPEEAERCRSYRSCPTFSVRSHVDFEINGLRREIADIEELMMNVGSR